MKGGKYLLHFFLFALLAHLPQSNANRKSYIVYMGDHLDDGVSTSLLHASMLQYVFGSESKSVLCSYNKSFNGFVVDLNEEEAQKMAGIGPPPTKWKGSCQVEPSDNFTCNKKIIGAKYYRSDGMFFPSDLASPRDSDGHGTHTASTAAGNSVHGVSLFGFGSAAYVKSFHPTWSPAAIQSALMTTASPMSPSINLEAEFAYGSGHLNPLQAANPGLVYDANEADFITFLCRQGYATRFLRLLTKDNSTTCLGSTNGTVSDLNYPSFGLSTSPSKALSRSFKRTVTNVGSPLALYRADLSFPTGGLNVRVDPDVLVFTSVGQKLSFEVVIEGTFDESLVSGSLVWDDGEHKVRSPIVVFI
ncbi:hypothetical protein V6N11_005747 [Hibiscus sabdariffa]|uniref:Cucumisin n=1 Tax=Hibiscus sabdariffa TaxID=183260 RepID=A0ABR2RNS8_9ROSI